MILAVTISGYIIGLFVFYLFASFGQRAWDMSYFGWAKIFDVGLLMWAYLYFNGSTSMRKLAKWLYYFAVLRFVFDIQTFFTGVGVNNEPFVAILFVCLIVLASILLIRDNGKPTKWISKRLNI
jgi:hypothetical protein